MCSCWDDPCSHFYMMMLLMKLTQEGQVVNALYDNKTSIMFGDILYSRAFTELSQMDKKVAYTISNAKTF